MTVSEIRTYINTVLNKDNSGNSFSLDELNLMFEAHIFAFVKDRILQYRQYLASGNLPDNVVFTSFLIEALEKTTVLTMASSYVTLPADFMMASSLVHQSVLPTKNIEFVSVDEYNRRWDNLLSKPIEYYPVAYILGSSCYVRPYETGGDYALSYIKKPAIPIFDYYTDANDNIIALAASSSHLLATGEVGSAGQTVGTTVNSLTVELDIPEELHLPFADYILSKVMIRNSDATRYQMNQNEIANQV